MFQDKRCDLKIHYDVDKVMTLLCELLDVQIPQWQRPVVRILSPLRSAGCDFPKFVVDPSLSFDANDLKLADHVEPKTDLKFLKAENEKVRPACVLEGQQNDRCTLMQTTDTSQKQDTKPDVRCELDDKDCPEDLKSICGPAVDSIVSSLTDDNSTSICASKNAPKDLPGEKNMECLTGGRQVSTKRKHSIEHKTDPSAAQTHTCDAESQKRPKPDILADAQKLM